MPVYMTPACGQKLRAELKEFHYKLQPEMVNTTAWAAGSGGAARMPIITTPRRNSGNMTDGSVF
jgi:hypothetical protein